MTMKMSRIGTSHYAMCDTEILGEGAFGEVKLGFHGGDMKTKLAIKRITKSKLSTTMREHLKVEVDVLRRCLHPNIVPLRDVVETEDDVYFVMDYVNGGDLFDFVVARGKLDEPLARRAFGQLADAVNYLHNHLGVIHHDLKLENLLVELSAADPHHDVSVKLSDFGLCCTVQRPTDILTKFSGTEAYCSPEVLEGRPYNGSANEVYAMGVILYILVTGAYPFDSEIELQVAQQTDYSHLSSLPFPRQVSRECRDLVLTLLDPNPRKRPTIERVLAHPFLQPYVASSLQALEKKEQDELQFALEQEDELLGCEEEINVCEVSVADEEQDDDAGDDDDDDAVDALTVELSVMVDEDDEDFDSMLQ